MQRQTTESNALERKAAQITRPSKLNRAVYLLFTRLISLRRFHSLRVAHADRLPGPRHSGPLLVVVNHASWWDPLPILLLQMKLMPERIAYAPSDAEALEKARSLRRVGSFPVATGTLSGTKAFIRDCRYILSLPDSILFITPEGEFTDPRIRPLRLRRGVATLLSKMGPVTVLPLAFEYTFWSDPRPEILTSWGEPICVQSGASMTTDEWQAKLTASLTATMDELAGISMRREHWRFENIAYGRLGPRNLLAIMADLKALLRSERR